MIKIRITHIGLLNSDEKYNVTWAELEKFDCYAMDSVWKEILKEYKYYGCIMSTQGIYAGTFSAEVLYD